MRFHDAFPTADERRVECMRVRRKHPNRIPLIANVDARHRKKLPELTHYRYLVPNDLTNGQFLYVLRKKMKLPPEKALFLFVGSDRVMPPTSALVGATYLEHKDKDDGFMYVTVTGEETFGDRRL